MERQDLKNIYVVKIEDGEIKSAYTKNVLEKLPEWFGNKQALDQYVIEAAKLPYWAAMDQRNICAGFFYNKNPVPPKLRHRIFV